MSEEEIIKELYLNMVGLEKMLMDKMKIYKR